MEDTGNIRVPEREALPNIRTALDLLPAITEVCRVLSERTAAAVRDGFAPLVLGGDHSLGAGSVAGVATAFASQARAGTWAAASVHFPNGSTGPQNVAVLPDGRILGDAGELSNQWYTLAPAANGSYLNGTWTPVGASSSGHWAGPS